MPSCSGASGAILGGQFFYARLAAYVITLATYYNLVGLICDLHVLSLAFVRFTICVEVYDIAHFFFSCLDKDRLSRLFTSCLVWATTYRSRRRRRSKNSWFLNSQCICGPRLKS